MSPAASASLSTKLPDVGQLTSLVSTLQERMGEVGIPKLPLADIVRLTDGLRLDLPDVSRWPVAIPTTALRLLADFPDPRRLVEPLQAPLDQFRLVLAFDPAAEAARMRERLLPLRTAAEADPVSVFGKLFAPGGPGATVLADLELTRLVIALAKFFGVSGADQIPARLADLLGQLQTGVHARIGATVSAAIAIGAAATTADRVDRVVGGLEAAFSLDTRRLRLQAVLSEFDAATAQVASLDLSDAVAVGALRDRLQATQSALTACHAGLARDLAFTEAGLVVLGAFDVPARLAQAEAILARVDAPALAEIAESLGRVVQAAAGKLDLDAEMDLGGFKSMVARALATVREQLDRLDLSIIARTLSTWTEAVNGPLKTLEEFKAQVEGTVRAALQAVADAVAEVDLGMVRREVEQTVARLDGRLQELAGVFAGVSGDVESAVGQAETALGGARDFLLDPNDGLKKKMDDVFGGLRQVLDDLNVQELVETMSVTVESIGGALRTVAFAPIIDATISAIEGVTDAISAVVPLLVTDDLKQKLAEATEFLREVDFEAIAAELRAAFDEILASVNSESLDCITEGYRQAVEAFGQFDPQPLLRDLQTEVFDPLIAELETIKPAAILEPVQSAYDEAAGALRAFDPTRSLAFITEFFDQVTAKLADISPAALLEPIERALGELRAEIHSVLRISDISAALDHLGSFLDPLLRQLDPAAALEPLEEGITQLRAAIAGFDPATLVGPLATVLRDAVATGGIDLTGGGLGAFFRAVRGQASLGERYAALTARLTRQEAQLKALDLKADLLALRGRHDTLTASLTLKAAGAPVSLELSALVAGLDPMPLVSPVIGRAARVQQAFSGAVETFADGLRRSVGALQAVESRVTAFAAFGAPLTALQSALLAPMRRFAPAAGGPQEVLLGLLDAIDPRQWKAEIQAVLGAIRDKLAVLTGAALLDPLKETLRRLKAVVDALNITALGDAISGTYAAVTRRIEALNPAPVILALGQAYQRVLTLLDALDPREFIARIDSVWADGVLGVVRAISPEALLLPPLREAFEQITATLGALDVERVFAPVLGQLRSLQEQLTGGLEQAGAAYTAMLDALPA